jgi:hypothetical protein
VPIEAAPMSSKRVTTVERLTIVTIQKVWVIKKYPKPAPRKGGFFCPYFSAPMAATMGALIIVV